MSFHKPEHVYIITYRVPLAEAKGIGAEVGTEVIEADNEYEANYKFHQSFPSDHVVIMDTRQLS